MHQNRFLLLSPLLALITSVFGVAPLVPKPAKITFSKSVEPIFRQYCIECHRPGELAPMSLLIYKEARPWAKAIREKVLSREMPPWHADPRFGRFSNDRRLTQQEIDTIVAWVDGGSLEGDPRDLAPAPQFSGDWKIGKPDLILSMPEEYTIKAQGQDEYIDFVIPTNFDEYKWVERAEIHPGNRKVVHHVIAYIQSPERASKSKANTISDPPVESIFYREGTLLRAKLDAPVYDDGCSAPNRGISRGGHAESVGPVIGFYAPGKDRDDWPKNAARGIPPGSNIVLQIHYSKTAGEAVKDRTSVGFIFAKEPPEKSIVTNAALNHYFKIPADAADHEVKACYDFRQDILLLSLMPHMHRRGKDMKYEVIYPDARRETILSVPAYNFNWQTLYKFEEPISIPKGSLTAHYDNSNKNRNNPDPTKEVRWGDPTYDEMMIGYFDYFVNVPERASVNVAQKILDSYLGEYEVFPGKTITVTKSVASLMLSSSGLPAVPIFAETETKFFLRLTDVQLRFVNNDVGEVSGLILDQGGRVFKAKKLK